MNLFETAPQALSLWAMLGGGLLAFVSPCVLPMLPVYAMYLVGGDKENRGRFAVLRRCLVPEKQGELKLRVILDKYSAEVFVNDGEQVMTATFMTDLAAQGISFFADGQVEMDITKYELFAEE